MGYSGQATDTTSIKTHQQTIVLKYTGPRLYAEDPGYNKDSPSLGMLTKINFGETSLYYRKEEGIAGRLIVTKNRRLQVNN
ncbi:MAG: hypothetical protein M3270_05435 [Thermoproteota archaeon]|nr:hypothetical protein [Thermoproteota archaeon]